ncbi:hypothetical protein [Mycoplasma todarodis]|uniref:hypothetical protein n=1 Tax=Mycoplasma todarodis TaxID=1937191 RepID=UPI003B387600
MKKILTAAITFFTVTLPLFLISCGRTIQEGPRGGKYYRNANGNKTYVDRSTPTGNTTSNVDWIVPVIVIFFILLIVIIIGVSCNMKNAPSAKELKERKLWNLASERADNYISNEWKYIPRKYDGRHTYASNARYKENQKHSVWFDKRGHYFQELKEESENADIEKSKRYTQHIGKTILWEHKKWKIVNIKNDEGLASYKIQQPSGYQTNIFACRVIDQLKIKQTNQERIKNKTKTVTHPKEVKTSPLKNVGLLDGLPNTVSQRYIIEINSETGDIKLYRKWDKKTFRWNAFNFKKLTCYEDPYAEQITSNIIELKKQDKK